MNLLVRRLILGVFAFGVLMLLYAETTRFDFTEHKRFDDQLDDLQKLDTTLNQDVLKVRFRLLGDYDTLGEKLHGMQRAVGALANVPAFMPDTGRQALRAKLVEFSALFARKEQLVESFKSVNAVLNNSLRYLPVAGTELLAHLTNDDEGRTPVALVNELLQHVLVYCLNPGEDEVPALSRSLDQIAGWRLQNPAHPQTAALAAVAAHVRSILTRKPKIEELTQAILSIPTASCAEQLRHLYEGELAGVLREVDRSRLLLKVGCALLLLGIGCAFYALDSAKRNVEQRVRERTRDLQIEVNERKRTEAELLESKRFLQSAMDALSAHIGILDEEGRIIAANGAWSTFALANSLSGDGYGVGANYLEVCDRASGVCSAEAAAAASGIREVITRRTPEFQLEYPCHSPEEQRWFVVRVTRFQGNGSGGVVVAHENITERKQAEQALREGEERYRSLVEATTAIVWDTPASGEFETEQPSWAAFTGQSFDEYRGWGWLNTIHPDDQAHTARTWSAAVANRDIYEVEHRLRARDRTYRHMMVRGVPMLAQDGTIRQWVGIHTDITERKCAEAELAAMNNQLLDVSRQAGMAEVATNVLHNVGNVLNSVNVSATLVADGVKKSKVGDLARVVAVLDQHAADLGAFMSSDPKGKKLPEFLRHLSEHLGGERQSAIAELESLRTNIEHIKDIVTMQQSYAKVSGVTEILKVTDLIEDSLRMNAGALVRHEVQVVREYQEVPPISVEKHKVLQILVNLIRNAKYACDEAGVPDKRMTLRVVNGGGTVKISVSDNGVGVPPENLTRIFNHGFTTRKEGHGFGLHSGALAAQELGGSLRAHSDGHGHGATFTLELPLNTPAFSL